MKQYRLKFETYSRESCKITEIQRSCQFLSLIVVNQKLHIWAGVCCITPHPHYPLIVTSNVFGLLDSKSIRVTVTLD